MKTAFVFLLIGILSLYIIYLQVDIRFSDRMVIHVHDTYLVIDYSNVAVVAGIFLVTLFSLGGLLGTMFRNSFFIILFLCCLVAIGYVAWYVNVLLTS